MSHFNTIIGKIQTRNQLSQTVLGWKNEKLRIVFTNGCFDLLHRGHVDYLSKAADLGDKLVIGLNSDASVSKLKGPHRPITDQDSRAFLLASLAFVDAVVIFDEDTPADLINLVRPDVLVKGGDYEPKDIVGYDTVIARGGEVIALPLVKGYSTTDIETRIVAGRDK